MAQWPLPMTHVIPYGSRPGTEHMVRSAWRHVPDTTGDQMPQRCAVIAVLPGLRLTEDIYAAERPPS